MNRLPEELIEYITSYLNISDKLNCIRVCQHWHTIIACTNLYRDLDFGYNQLKFQKANQLLQEKQDYGKQVTRLNLHTYTREDHVAMYVLLQLLPNLKQLHWYSCKDQDYTIDLPLPNDTAAQYSWSLIFSKLKKLEDIRADINYFRFPWILDLLGSTSFCNLTKLDVRITGGGRHGSHFTRELIDSIKNTPALDYLKLSEAVIDLDDMEVLHANAPKLKTLFLFVPTLKTTIYDTTTINVSDNGRRLIGVDGSFIVQTAVTHLTSFSLSISSDELPSGETVFEIEEFQQTLQKWVIYMSQKYTNIQQLQITATEDFGPIPLACTNLLEKPLINTIHNMKDKACKYYVLICPLTRNIVTALDNENVVLKKLIMNVDNNNFLTQISALKSSTKLKKHIESLDMDQAYSDEVDPCVLYAELIDLGKTMPNLSSLYFDCSNLNLFYPSQLVADIVQHLPHVQDLRVNTLEFDRFVTPSSSLTTTTSQLKSLYIDTNTGRILPNFYWANRLLKQVFQQCPHLQDFTIRGGGSEFDASGMDNPLCLDLSSLQQLKKINIDIDRVSYYRFNVPGIIDENRWLDYKNTVYLAEEESCKEYVFHVDITLPPPENCHPSVTLYNPVSMKLKN